MAYLNDALQSIHMECQYLDLVQRILATGQTRETRNGKVRSLFGAHISHDLSSGFPLLTTKKMFWRGIAEELAWFLRGSTNVQELRDKKVHIWDGNSEDRDYDAGPVYGFQWRHFGAEYTDCRQDYSGQGVDQIAKILELLRTNPTSRRMVLSAWCPIQQDQMCLPPCHVMYQFYVEKDNRLSCMMTQRSADVFLGLPFNIASTSLLVHLMACVTGFEPGRVHINVGDAHIYEEHVDVCKKQILRTPTSLPKLVIAEVPDEGLHDFKPSQVHIADYICAGALKAKMKA